MWAVDIMDISIEGMQLRSREQDHDIPPGEVLWFETELPDPVGVLDRPVRVMNVRCDDRTGRDMFGIVLVDPPAELGEFIRAAELRRAARRRSA